MGLASSVLASAPAVAADKSTPDEEAIAAGETTNPLSIKEQLKFRPIYAFPDGETRYKAELQFAGVLPYPGVLIPDLALDGVWSIARIRLTGESLQDATGTAGGLQDLNFVDLVAKRCGPDHGGGRRAQRHRGRGRAQLPAVEAHGPSSPALAKAATRGRSRRAKSS